MKRNVKGRTLRMGPSSPRERAFREFLRTGTASASLIEGRCDGGPLLSPKGQGILMSALMAAEPRC